MNQNNQAWRKIFDNIEFNDQYNVSLGTIEKVFVENKTNGWRIVLSLPEVLTLEVMEDLTNKVREYCLKEFKVKTVKFNVKVKEIQIEVNPENINNVVGHKKENIQKLKDLYDVDVKVKQNKEIKSGKFEISVIKTYTDFLDE